MQQGASAGRVAAPGACRGRTGRTAGAGRGAHAARAGRTVRDALLVWACVTGAAAAAAAAPAVSATGATGSAARAPAESAPPRVNLAAEWRWSESVPRRPAPPGAVVTSTLGAPAPAQGQVAVRSGAPGAPASALPALPTRIVLANGSGARVRLAEAVPLQTVQAWQEPGGTGAALVPGWVEAVQALELRVRWPGGSSPAEVELEVEQAQPPAADGTGAAARRERLATRAWLPMGEWVTVAAWGAPAGGATPAADPGTVSTSALAVRPTRVLQLRLSPVAP